MARDKSHRTSNSNFEKNSSRSENYRGESRSKKQTSQTSKDLYKTLKGKK